MLATRSNLTLECKSPRPKRVPSLKTNASGLFCKTYLSASSLVAAYRERGFGSADSVIRSLFTPYTEQVDGNTIFPLKLSTSHFTVSTFNSFVSSGFTEQAPSPTKPANHITMS